MPNDTLRLVACYAAGCLAILQLATPKASAQIKWNVTYQDVVENKSFGFNDPTIFSGSLTHGQARQDSFKAALDYLGTQLDGRGTVDLTLKVSQTDGNGSLASFGAAQISGVLGSFQNGGVYQVARTNNRPHPGEGPDGQGVFDFGYGYNYHGQTVDPGRFDLVTVAIHEVTHGLGFSSFFYADQVTWGTGAGLANRPVGTPDIYSGYAKSLQRGSGVGGSLFNTDINSANYGSFTGPLDTLTNGNDPTTGLFFGGQYAREVYGGAVPIHAPNPFKPGASTSHVEDGNAVMNPNIAPNVVKRFLRYEIAMLMDSGWNVYNWDNGNGNWKDGVTGIPPNETYNVNNSNWRTDLGIVYDGSQTYNIHDTPEQAPVLPPYGQVTSNIVLNFGGSGSTAYTSTNDLGTIRVSRLNLNSTSTETNTITGGALNFGLNSDGTASVLTPKIVQQNSGAFTINTDLQVNNTTGALGGGWTGLTVDGPGSGQVTLGGVISGDGTLTKAGNFTLQISGGIANTYTGLTTVQAGTLLLSKTPGQNAMAGSLTITGGIARLAAADQLPSTGSTTPVVTLEGGTLSTGATTGHADVVGAFEMTSASTIALGTDSHILQFTGFKDDSLAGALTVTGWTGSVLTAGADGRILISDVTGIPNLTYATWLTTVQFEGYAPGAIFITAGLPANTVELVPIAPIPEPATVVAMAFAALGVGALVRRRRVRLAEAAIAP
jgi:autotransporter-associated beta strand protein